MVMAALISSPVFTKLQDPISVQSVHNKVRPCFSAIPIFPNKSAGSNKIQLQALSSEQSDNKQTKKPRKKETFKRSRRRTTLAHSTLIMGRATSI
jgi:hypothetical protein